MPLFFTELDDDCRQAGKDVVPKLIRCDLCPNYCVIKNGSFGVCGVRGNKNGKCITPFYGLITALAVDPIEKKPLYHFKPGTKILSLGFNGCNLRCPFCQNWQISQCTDKPGAAKSPGEIISAALKQNTPSIAYTYSEPLIHIEFLLDCMALAHKHGIANVLVTNGCINKQAAQEILKFTDAANVDLKSFSSRTYSETLGRVSGADILQVVLDFIRLAFEMNVHTEITTLIVPGLNDSKDELNAACDFIVSLSSRIPWHLTAYHPDYRWNAPPTNPAFLLNAAADAKKKLSFVYTGNI